MIHKNAVGKIDPYRLSGKRGPLVVLEPHIDSCELEDLPEYAAKLRKKKNQNNQNNDQDKNKSSFFKCQE